MDRSSREKRVAAGFATGVAMIAAPFVVTLAFMLYVFLRYRGKLPGRGIEPGFRVSGGSGVKTMSEVMNMLEDIPFRRGVPRIFAMLAMTLLDFLPTVLNTNRATAGILYPYPDVFEPVMLESQDGTPLFGLMAMQRGSSAGPALILVHGLFSSKNTYGMLSLALKAYYEWHLHVMVLDLRNFGDSGRFSDAPTSWGYREADDILAAAEYLDSLDAVSTVGLLGVSMGAASSLIAAGRSGLDRPLSGGVVALNGYADARRAVEHVSTLAPGSLESFASWLFFRAVLLCKTLLGGPRPMSDLGEYTRQVASQYYEVTGEELFRKASPVHCVRDIDVPCLIIHSLDDTIVPVEEADDLIEAASDNPMVAAMVLPRGGHALYQLTNPGWFYGTIGTFLTYWGEAGLGPDLTRDGIDTLDFYGNPNN
jgi:pimeloyl-ACP methyl ester carboxylesterase